MKKQILCLLLALVMVLGLAPATLAANANDEALPTDRACEHTYKYVLCGDSKEATDTEGGYRHYKCSECGAEYAYSTDPMVYVDGFKKQNGEVVEVNETNNGSVNPNLPLWEHIPDAEPHVFWSKADLEWRVYIYGSHDTGNIICGQDQVVWSAPVYDLSDWRFDGQIYDVYEKETTARLNALFAPDTDYDVTTDTFYMMTFEVFDMEVLSRCTAPDGRFDAEGNFVYAFSESTGWGPYVTTDPAIYIENGTIYVIASAAVRDLSSADYVAGLTSAAGLQEELDLIKASGESGTCPQFALICQMKADPSEGVEKLHYCSIDNKGFLPINEGVSLRYDAESGQYIMVYFGNKNGSGGGLNNGLAYVYTDDLMNGEWKMGDNTLGDNVIHDNNGVYLKNPTTGAVEKSENSTYSGGNNHGGLVKINGSWYIFGHVTDNTHRMNTIEKVELNYKDGKLTIPAVEMTSAGAGESLDAYDTWDAGIFCYQVSEVGGSYNSRNGAVITSYEENTKSSHGDPGTYDMNLKHVSPVKNIKNGNVLGYKYLDFGEGAKKTGLKLLVSKEEDSVDGTMDVYLDAPSAEAGGKKIGTVTLSAAAIEASKYTETGSDGRVWTWLSADMTETVSGKHAVYFVFAAEETAELTDDEPGGGEGPGGQGGPGGGQGGPGGGPGGGQSEPATPSLCLIDQFRFTDGNDATERTCDHTYSYQLCEDSKQATDTEGGYRHYKCSVCGDEYSYKTDPMVYADGFVKQNGEVVEVNETNAGATNPYLPLWEHIADAEPHVFWSKEDLEWRLYVFGSHDTTGIICGNDYVTWSAPVYDLSDWRYEGETLRIDVSNQSSGGGFGFGGNMGKLFAPDCCYDENTDAFYMISYDNSVSLCNVYRATEPDANYGELDDIVFKITLGTPNVEEGLYGGSDPAILFDDGVMYITCNGGADTASKQGDPEITEEVNEFKNVMLSGSGRLSIAMLYKVEEIDGKWAVTDHSYLPIAGSEYHFFPMEEATSLRKDEATGTYILVYNGGGGTRADGVKHQTTGMSYAYTTDLMGEWHYGENGFGDDVIQDNHGHYLRDANGEMQLTDKETMCANNDSNHGGVVKVNGKWYVFGHINTSNGCRQGIAEQIDVEYKDGKLLIGATEETSSGLADNLDAYETWDAGIACYRTPATSVKATGYLGNHGAKEPVEIDFNVSHYAPMKGLGNGAVIGYKYLDFGGTKVSTTLNLLVYREEEGYIDGAVDIYLDAPSEEEGGTKLGSMDITAEGIAASEKTETGTDGKVWSWISAKMDQKISGEHAVFFVFSSDEEEQTEETEETENGELTDDEPGESGEQPGGQGGPGGPGGQGGPGGPGGPGGNQEPEKTPVCLLDQFSFTKGKLFEDVMDDSQYFFDPVYWAFESDPQITTGTSETKFSPDAGCTRAQVVTFLWRAAGEPEPTSTANPFVDVKEGAYYYKAVLWAVEQGITTGTTATTFRPDQTCTRGQIVTFLWRYSGKPKPEKNENPFADVAAGQYYCDAVLWAVEKGITNGTTPTTFRPDQTCTRAQIVTFLYRAMR